MSWQDLSDGELRSRLENRGVNPDTVEAILERRDDLDVEELEELLGQD